MSADDGLTTHGRWLRDAKARNDNWPTTKAGWTANGKAIAESGKYVPPRGKFLGRIQSWGLDVYEGSPQPWIDTLFAEQEQTGWSNGDGA